MGLWILYAFTTLSVLGFATFGLHPELLTKLSPASLEFYAVSFRFFALGQVWLAGLVLAVFLSRRVGLRWIPALLLTYSLSLVSELLGTTYGIPFGAYSYSEVLAPMWLGRVPIGIPLSWFYMALPAYALALHAQPRDARPRSTIALGSLILLAWDLALDPAMSGATKYWQWGEQGPYYGMPLLNLFGWYVTGLVLMGAFSLLRSASWVRELPIRWLTGFYAANLLLPLGMVAAAGMWGAFAVTVAVLASTWAIAGWLSRRAVGDEPLVVLSRIA